GEMTSDGSTLDSELEHGEIRVREIVPEDAGLGRARLRDLLGGEPDENVRIARGILDGERGPRRDVVLLNAAAALLVAGRASDLEQGARQAAEAIDSGAARGVLERLRALCPIDDETR